ncbi:MAG: hypothetical protein FWD78_07745 [Treponema sp.]|nr:hypothetical protein [Treponema sp.]
MAINKEEKFIIRELARQVKDLAALDINRQRINRIKDMHSLKPVRPPVWIDELPWHEMNIDDELTLRCTDKKAQQMEMQLRRVLFRWKHIQADMVVEDTFYVNKTYTESDLGVEVMEKTAATNAANHIISHHYEDQLDTEEKLDGLKMPVITAEPQTDKVNLEITNDVFDGIMPVRLRGYGIYYAPWDVISRLRGVEKCYMDMISNPDLIHKTMKKFTEIYTSRYNQMQELGLLDYNVSALHCTPPYTDELPASDYDGGKIRFKDIWFRGMAQLFGSVSPQMQDEFDLQYMRPMMDKCGLSYYGCCEPLDKFIPWLKKVPNMRKIGVSPWANVRSSAEQIGGSYVLARKPNPANVARVFDKQVVVNEIRETIEAALANKCPYEFVIKDISTVNYKPQNLIDWSNTVQEVIDKYY